MTISVLFSEYPGPVRYPRGTPYQGPTANYDHLISPEQNLARVAYGLPRPLLAPGARMDSAFYGRLLDELANAHAVLVKICGTQGTAKNVASRLRPELPSELYEIGVKQDEDDPRPDVWLVIAYNRVSRSLIRPSWMNPTTPSGDQWVDVKEAAYVLGISRSHVHYLIDRYGLETRISGGRREHHIRRGALLRLANRPGRWQRRKKTA